MADKVEAYKRAFRHVIVDHPKQREAFERTLFLVLNNPPETITVLAGPTGTGKSQILKMIATAFVERHAAAMESDPSFVPMARALAVSSGYAAYDFRRLFTDTQKSLGDPFADIREQRADGRKPSSILLAESPSVALLREQLENQFRERHTLLWAIDEAHHILGGGKGDDPNDQLDVLKSISQTATPLGLLLAGPSELPDWMIGSGHLARRKQVVPLHRYLYDDPEELRQFSDVVHSILTRTPTKSVFPEVRANIEYFYVYAVGCVGIFKEWAERAYSLSLKGGINEISLDHFKRTRLRPEDLSRIRYEIQQFEARYSLTPGDVDEGLRKFILAGPSTVESTEAASGRDSAKGATLPRFRVRTRRNGPRGPSPRAR